MGFFDIFKKKKEKPLTAEDRWNRIWQLWEIGDLQPPITNLLTYQSEINNGGHSQYFFNIANSGDLKTEVEAVLSVLPEPLRENLFRGYTAFSRQDDITDDANDALFEECDMVFYENEQRINEIIQKAADNGFQFCPKVANHPMKLRPEPFEKIKSGQKTIELRLWDEKRQQIKEGDTISFTNTATGEMITKRVQKLHRFESFAQLYKALPLLQCGYTEKDIDTAHPMDMEQYYSVEEQEKYGVVGIALCDWA